MIKKFSFSFILLASLYTTTKIKAFETADLFSLIDSIESTDTDIFSANSMNYTKELFTPQTTLRAFTRSCASDCDGILEAQNIFAQDLYQFTHPINQRSILDYPEFYFYACLPCWCGDKIWQPFVHLFYNETHKGNFTRDRTGINSYLSFESIPNFEQFGLDVNTPRVLDLFKNLKIQERRAGVMLGGAHHYEKWFFSFRTPLEYLLRNFFLTPQEVKAIQSDPLFNDLDPATDDAQEVMKFAREHLVSDRIGVGDTFKC